MPDKALGKAPRYFTYAQAGVDRELRAKSKKALKALTETYRFSQHGPVIRLPYGNVFPIGNDLYLDLAIEGVGSKVLLAQLAEKYDTIGIDGVAMAVNDVIRSGARPLAVADNIHACVSEPVLVEEWIKGIATGAGEAECIVSGGEIGDVPDLIKGIAESMGFDIVVSCVAQVHKDRVISAKNLKLGDFIIGLRSSGVHSNGISLARKVLFKLWGGKYEPHDFIDVLDRELILEVLEPTKIYVKPIMELASEGLVKAAVHITGDAYVKFDRLMMSGKKVGFEFDNIKPQAIFKLIQKTSKEIRRPISEEEMLKTFNMGWGFAVVVDKSEADEALDILERNGAESEPIGRVTSSGAIVVRSDGRSFTMKR